jgi:hypothetical protein
MDAIWEQIEETSRLIRDVQSRIEMLEGRAAYWAAHDGDREAVLIQRALDLNRANLESLRSRLQSVRLALVTEQRMNVAALEFQRWRIETGRLRAGG